MKIPYHRHSPSPRYSVMLELYRKLHREGDAAEGRPAEKTFDGRSLTPHTATIRDLLRRFSARSLLDYGAGKGLFYGLKDLREETTGQMYPDIKSYWDLDRIQLYDPAYELHGDYPLGRFDAVISTDVLEHIPEEDIP